MAEGADRMTVGADLVPVDVDRARVLAAFGLNVRDPNAQAALLVCQRYDLDPLLKHVQLIKQQVYITRDGYLHVAHQSGVFNGMELLDEGETNDYFWAKVAVYRRDMARPFIAKARCRKDEKTFADPWDQAVTRAERRALKRAFDVSGLVSVDDVGEDERFTDDEPMSTEQRERIFATLHELGVSEDDRHAFVSQILGRTVQSFTHLTMSDAGQLIDQLEHARKEEATPAREDHDAGAPITDGAPAIIPAAALDSIRRLATRKNVTDGTLTEWAGKPLDTLTITEANALTRRVTEYVKPDDDPGREF